MSRIGRKPIPVPKGVEVTLANGSVKVKGQHGELTIDHHPNISVEVEDGEIKVSRPDDQRFNRALHGLTRSLIANMVQGVEKPYEKSLEIHGVGYNASLNGNKLSLQVGYANTVVLEVPAIVSCEVAKNNQGITLRSPDKQAVGQFAANIRKVRPPEPYKGKGIRYTDERVRRKAGKADAKK